MLNNQFDLFENAVITGFWVTFVLDDLSGLCPVGLGFFQISRAVPPPPRGGHIKVAFWDSSALSWASLPFSPFSPRLDPCMPSPRHLPQFPSVFSSPFPLLLPPSSSHLKLEYRQKNQCLPCQGPLPEKWNRSNYKKKKALKKNALWQNGGNRCSGVVLLSQAVS